MNRRIKLLLSSAIVACVAGTSASAQTAGSNIIEELVVTAQKREESLQDVPVAVSAFTDETRDIVGIRTIQDFATFTPGLSFNAGSDRMSLRGVGRLTNVLGSDPGVAVYADGFYTASNSEAAPCPATPASLARIPSSWRRERPCASVRRDSSARTRSAPTR